MLNIYLSLIQGWVSSGRNLFLPGHPEKSGRNWKKLEKTVKDVRNDGKKIIIILNFLQKIICIGVGVTSPVHGTDLGLDLQGCHMAPLTHHLVDPGSVSTGSRDTAPVSVFSTLPVDVYGIRSRDFHVFGHHSLVISHAHLVTVTL